MDTDTDTEEWLLVEATRAAGLTRHFENYICLHWHLNWKKWLHPGSNNPFLRLAPFAPCQKYCFCELKVCWHLPWSVQQVVHESEPVKCYFLAFFWVRAIFFCIQTHTQPVPGEAWWSPNGSSFALALLPLFCLFHFKSLDLNTSELFDDSRQC